MVADRLAVGLGTIMAARTFVWVLKTGRALGLWLVGTSTALSLDSLWQDQHWTVCLAHGAGSAGAHSVG